MDEERIADWIAGQRRAGESIAALPTDMKPASEEAAYRIQTAVLARLTAAGGGEQVGWKVGVTTPQMRAALGIDAPIGGAILAGGRFENGAELRPEAFCRVGIECEIAMVLGAPLGGPGHTVDAREAEAAVASVHHAIEVIDDRYGGNYRGIGVPAIIADNSFHAGFVLGPPVANWQRVDLAIVRGVTRANGKVFSEGRGGDVQGHPMNSLAWLATRLGALGGRIEAGQIVSTGSLPLHYWAEPGDRVDTEIEGIGALGLTIRA
jgi:2-keto-4-pentenoate hydratase